MQEVEQRRSRCREAIDGNIEIGASITWGLLCKIKRSHPCVLDSGNPCRNVNPVRRECRVGSLMGGKRNPTLMTLIVALF